MFQPNILFKINQYLIDFILDKQVFHQFYILILIFLKAFYIFHIQCY